MKNFVLIFSILLLVSCTKDKTVSGRVYNPVNNKGIAGIKIYLMKPKFCINYDGCADKILETTTTDADGNYAIKYRESSKGQYLLFDNDLTDFYTLDSNSPYVSGNEVYNFRLVTKGYLQYSVINTNCFDANDKLTITHSYHKSLPDLLLLTGVAMFPGCMNQTYSNSYVPMGWYVWKGTVTKNNITTPFADSIYVPEGGSVQWNIEY